MKPQTIFNSQLFFMAILVAFLFLPLTSMAQPSESPIWIDGERVMGTWIQTSSWSWNCGYANYASVDSATVTSDIKNGVMYSTGYLYNHGMIFNATAKDGYLWNTNIGTIEKATVNGIGSLNNDGTITNATVNSGSLNNNSGTIDTVTTNGGNVYNRSGTIINVSTVGNAGYIINHGGTIINATINGRAASVINYYSSTIVNATVNDGRVANEGMITNAMVNGGTLSNYGYFINYDDEYSYDDLHYNYGTITNVTQNGGTVNNEGRIENMIYIAGTYCRQFIDGWKGDGEFYPGTIGTLMLAGDSTGIDWGDVDNVQFHENGNGVLSLSAMIDDPLEAMGISTALPEISFVGLNAQNIDFTNGNFVLDFSSIIEFSEEYLITSLFGGAGFELAAYLGTSNITGFENMNSFSLAFESGSLFIFSDGVWAKGWSLADGIITYEVPEPATLLILGLAGLGGLGYHRWRKK